MRRTTGTLFKRGSIYWARWYSNGKEFKLSTKKTTRKEAQDVLDEWVTPYRMKSDAETLRTLASRAEDLDLKATKVLRDNLALVKVWVRYKGTTKRKLPRPATLRQYEFQWGIFLKWISDNKPEIKSIEEVDDAVAEAFINHVRAKMTGGTVNKYRNLLTAIWTVLKNDGATDAQNPWEKIAAVEIVQHSRRELTLEELRSVCQSAPGDLRPLFAVGLYTGMRLGDCATLKWSEVDLERNIIRRIPNKSRKPKPVLIPIHPVLRVILVELARDGMYVMPRIAKDYIRHSSYVTDRVQRHLTTTCKISTTVPGEKGRAIVEVGFHSLRHSFVSLSRTAGAPLAVVEAIVGHANAAMTRHYSHIGEEAASQAVGLLPSVLEEDAKKSLPSALVVTDNGAALAKIMSLAGRMNSKNWKSMRDQIVILANPTAVTPAKA